MAYTFYLKAKGLPLCVVFKAPYTEGEFPSFSVWVDFESLRMQDSVEG